MRSAPTEAEKLPWQPTPRRQAWSPLSPPITVDRFIVYCPEHRLVVEVDGGVHESRVERDAGRDRMFALIGLTVLRVRNDEVLHDLESVVSRIAAVLHARAPDSQR